MTPTDWVARPLRLFLFAGAVVASLALGACSSPEERAAAYYKSGQSYLDKGDYQRAAVEFRNALKIKEDFAEAWFGMAKVEESNKNWRLVAGNLRRVLEISPKHLEALQALARLNLLHGDPAEALKRAQAAVELAPKDPNVIALKAAALLRIGDTGGAIEQAKAALAIDPNHVDSLLLLASERMKAKDLPGALAFLDRGLGVDSKSLGLRLAKLNVVEQQEDVPAQEKILTSLAADFPDDPAYRQALVTFYVRNNRSDEAEAQLRALADADPAKVEKQLDVVRFLRQTKGREAAEAELERLIAKGGANATAFKLSMASFETSENNYAKAAAILNDVIKAEGGTSAAADAKLQLASLQLRERNLADAERLANELIKADPKNVGAIEVRAGVRIQQRDFDGAVSDLRSAINEAPKRITLRLLLASAYERLGSIELAAKELTESLKLSDRDPGVGLDYVDFLLRRGKLDQAEDVLLDLNAKTPDNLDVLEKLAEVRIRRSDWSGARQVSNAIKRLGGSKAISDQIAAAALLGEGKIEDSIAAYKSANEAEPAQTDSMLRLVRAYLIANKLDEAEAFINTVIKANPQNVDAHVLFGALQRAKNAPDLAKASFAKAIEIDPKNPRGWRAAAELQAASGDGPGAIATLDKAIETVGPDPDLRFVRAGIYEFVGQIEKAIAEYEGLLAEDPGSIVLTNNLASLLSDYRDDPASLERAAALAAVLRDAPAPQFRDTLGWVLSRKGDHRAAIPILERTAAEMPDNLTAQYHLGMAYAAAGDKARAVDVLTKAQALDGPAAVKEKVAAALKSAQAPAL